MVTLLRKICDVIQFDLGELIFEEIIKHTNFVYPMLCLSFLSLIFQILCNQNPEIVLATEKYERKPIELSIHTSGLKGNTRLHSLKLFLMWWLSLLELAQRKTFHLNSQPLNKISSNILMLRLPPKKRSFNNFKPMFDESKRCGMISWPSCFSWGLENLFN
ncbi:hypothetical protein J1N35_045734 [Gossypium stocksii]|uniref:Uncharacterized protein n=1 Tax=Gossypium stocksii TaxID=47602 RepID=A0A9D3ZHC0_9ROSI|nr:hypothetical protein J1N35_045734 [Gossypium stocksii]